MQYWYYNCWLDSKYVKNHCFIYVEAEYIAVARDLKEFIWLQELSIEFGFIWYKSVVHSNSHTAMYMAKSSTFHFTKNYIEFLIDHNAEYRWSKEKETFSEKICAGFMGYKKGLHICDRWCFKLAFDNRNH